MDNIVFESEEFQSNMFADIQDEVIVEDPENFRCKIGVSEAEEQFHTIKYLWSVNKNFSYSYGVEDVDILWIGRRFQQSDVELVARLKKGATNKIHGCETFKYKSTQSHLLNQCKRYYPEEFSFHPGSYVLMKELETLKKYVLSYGPNKLWIAKPSYGLGGGGIFLFKTIDELLSTGTSEEMVVQHYIPNPLLIWNKKWDFRMYVIIHGINPMKAYISTEWGLGRFCTEDYDTSDTANTYAHLTNYTLNKNNEKYVNVGEDEEDPNPDEIKLSSKMPMQHVWKLIKKHYPECNIDDLRDKVANIARQVLRSHRPHIEVKCCEMMDMDMTEKENQKYFQILGLDIMFDTNYDAWLFETNRFPSMNISLEKDDDLSRKQRSVTDEKIKSTVLRELFRIVVGKQESKVFTKFYDSGIEGSDDAEFLYEKVVKVYRYLSGRNLRETLIPSDIYRLLSLPQMDLDLSSVDIESAIQRLDKGDNIILNIIDLFNLLELIAADMNVEFMKFIDWIVTKIQSTN